MNQSPIIDVAHDSDAERTAKALRHRRTWHVDRRPAEEDIAAAMNAIEHEQDGFIFEVQISGATVAIIWWRWDEETTNATRS